MQLRGYQSTWKGDIYNGWNYYQNILGVMPTGGGKTPVIADILNNHIGYCLAIAHRRELVAHLSMKLALCGLRHKIIAPKDVIKWIISLHIEHTGGNYYDDGAHCILASVDTMRTQWDKLKHIVKLITLWVIDEAHHCIRSNKWGQVVELFPHARGLGVTATPIRTDGKGLGRHASGVFDTIVEGPGMRDLINMGYLSDYRIFAPPSDFNRDEIPIGPNGELVQKQVIQEIKNSHIVGDVVSHYLRIAPGKLGMTFVTDVETGSEVAAKFKSAGVPSELVTAKTPGRVRAEIDRRFRRREILQIVNVDLFGEGTDVEELEAVSFARPTESLGLFRQQFGRVSRWAENKTAIVIDHVSNVTRHGLPDAPREWTLDNREKKSNQKKPTIPMRICVECTSPYEAIHKICPYCGNKHVPADRSRPEYVEGDLLELDPTVLKKMRGEIERIDKPEDILRVKMQHAGADVPAILGATKNHRLRQEAQQKLRWVMSWWAAHCEKQGMVIDEIYRKFYFVFGVDVMTAQTLSAKKAEELTVKVNKNIDQMLKTMVLSHCDRV